jgi:hypothetical protein
MMIYKDEIDDTSRGVTDKLSGGSARKLKNPDTVTNDLGDDLSFYQQPITAPFNSHGSPPSVFSIQVPSKPPVNPVFTAASIRGNSFPAAQSSAIPVWDDFCIYRKETVKLAWQEFKIWNAKGSKLHEPGSSGRSTLMEKYWSHVSPGKSSVPNPNMRAGESYVGEGPYKNWGSAFIAYLVKGVAFSLSGMITPFYAANIDTIGLAVKSKANYIQIQRMFGLISWLRSSPSNTLMGQNNNMSQYMVNLALSKMSYAVPLMFFNHDMISGVVLCEPGDILCFVNNKSENDRWMGKFNGVITPNLNMHVDCEMVVFAKYSKRTNKVIIRTIGGNIKNSVKSRLFCFDIVRKNDSATGQVYDEYDLKNELLMGIMKFPSCTRDYTYPVIG